VELLQFVALNLCGFDPGFDAGVKISHYIQPSNLSSALGGCDQKMTILFDVQ
jgi:hypothetical protein